MPRYVKCFKELNIDAGMVPIKLPRLKDNRCKFVNEPREVGIVFPAAHLLLYLFPSLSRSNATTDLDRESHVRNGHEHHIGIPELFVMDVAGKASMGQIVLRGQSDVE